MFLYTVKTTPPSKVRLKNSGGNYRLGARFLSINGRPKAIANISAADGSGMIVPLTENSVIVEVKLGLLFEIPRTSSNTEIHSKPPIRVFGANSTSAKSRKLLPLVPVRFSSAATDVPLVVGVFPTFSTVPLLALKKNPG